MNDLIKWLIQQQGNVTGLEISEETGISPSTWSKVRQGKSDITSDLLWKVMQAIAHHHPGSDIARVVLLIEGGVNWQKKSATPLLQIEKALENLSEEEQDEALLLMARSLRKNKRLMQLVR